MLLTMNESIIAKVKKITWHTDSKGLIKPLLHLTKKYSYMVKEKKKEVKYSLDALAIQSASLIEDMGLNKSSKVKIRMNDKGTPEVRKFGKKLKPFFPKKCPTCKNNLRWFQSELICTYRLCESQGRSVLFKLFEVCVDYEEYFKIPPEKEFVNVLDLWLTTFPTYGSESCIDNIFEFSILFKQVGEKNIAPRQKELVRCFGEEKGNMLFKFEKEIEEKFKTGFSAAQLWWIFNLPFFNMKEHIMTDIKKIIPQELDSKTTEKELIEKGIHEKAANSIIKNIGYWKNIIKQLDSLKSYEK